MAEFWKQQLMDRLLTLCFKFRKQENIVLPADEIKNVMDYVKFLLENKSKETAEDIQKG